MESSSKPLMILIAGPYRSGTGGASQGADQMVAVAQEKGLNVYYRLQDIPGCEEVAI